MHKIDTKCIVSLFDLVKIEFYRVKQNSIATIWLRYGHNMENGKSVANWWQNIGIDMIYYLRRKLDEFRVNLDLQEFRMWYAMYGIFVYKSKKALPNTVLS